MKDTEMNSFYAHHGRIHLLYLRIHKYFMDDPSVNFHDKFFPLFFSEFLAKNEEKTYYRNLQMSRP